MASVDGAKFCQTASDDILNQCEPCKYDDQEKPASHFCQDCNEYLCLECSNSHKKLTISRNHTTLPASQLSGQTASHNTSCAILCEGCHNVPVSDYCEQHHSVICQTCKSVRHRKCKSESVKEKSISYKKVNLDAVTKNAKDVEDKLDQLLRQRTEDLQKMTLLKENCVKEIKEFRQEINDLLDMLEEKSMNEMEECEKMERKEIERDLFSLTNTKQLLNTDSKLLQDVGKTTKEFNMFAADVKVSNHLKHYEIMLQDIAQETKLSLLTFKRNDQLNDMMNKANGLGTTMSNETGWKSNTKLFPDMTVKSCNQVDIKLPYELNTPWISGCDFLPNGQILLCDNKNSNVNLLSNSFKLETTIKLQDRPWDVSVVNSSDAIVTLPWAARLQFIQVKPTLKTGRTIQLDKDCWGIQVADENIYITLHRTGAGQVRILDFKGNCKKRISANQGRLLFTSPSYLTVSATSGRIYVSDTEKNTATCMESDGRVVYQYKSSDMESPRGICLDAADNLIMCSEKSYYVQIVSSSGQKVRNLLTVGGGDVHPRLVKYRPKDNTLFVGCENTNNMFLYLLK